MSNAGPDALVITISKRVSINYYKCYTYIQGYSAFHETCVKVFTIFLPKTAEFGKIGSKWCKMVY